MKKLISYIGFSIYSILFTAAVAFSWMFQIKEIIKQFGENNKDKFIPLIIFLLPFVVLFISFLFKSALANNIIWILAIAANLGSLILQYKYIVIKKSGNERKKAYYVLGLIGFELFYSFVMRPSIMFKFLNWIDNKL